MTDIPELREQIQLEETRAQAATSESVFMRVGGGINFINKRHVYLHDFYANGPYNIVAAPQTAVDGFLTYPFNYEILDVLVWQGPGQGTSGITEIDFKWKPEIGGAFATICSTTPKITPAAAANDFTRIGKVSTGFTAPVLSKTQFNAYDTIRMDFLQQMAGPVYSLYGKFFIRPR